MVFFMLMDDLCAQLAKDPHGGFEKLVAALGDDVYSGLRRIHPADAEDLTQETFIRAHAALATYEPERIRDMALRGWIWTIALNLGRNLARDRERRPRPVELHDIHAINDPEPVDTQIWQERLSRLSLAQRRAVVLRHVVGLSYPELAMALDRPEGTVKADVSRGLSRLRTILEEET